MRCAHHNATMSVAACLRMQEAAKNKLPNTEFCPRCSIGAAAREGLLSDDDYEEILKDQIQREEARKNDSVKI